MHLNLKRITKVFGVGLVSFFSALLGWCFSFEWDNKFLFIIGLILIGAILSSTD